MHYYCEMASNSFGNPNPWSEPAWYNSLASPYYKDSHRALRQYVREYVQKYIQPYAEEWEQAGQVPQEVNIVQGLYDEPCQC